MYQDKPEIGDFGVFWDDNVDRHIFAELINITAGSYVCSYIATKNFAKIDKKLPIQPQVDEIKRKFKNVGRY